MYNRKQYSLYGSKTVMFSPDNFELSGATVDSSRSGSSAFLLKHARHAAVTVALDAVIIGITEIGFGSS